MHIKKANRKNGEMHIAYSSGRHFRMSASLRDSILPYRFLFIDVESNDDCDILIMTPTNDPAGYKIVLHEGSAAQVTYCQLKHYVTIPAKKRIPVKKDRDGKFIVKLPKCGR